MLVLCAAVILIIDLEFSESTQPTMQVLYEPVWRYDDQLSWPGLACQHGGLRQSPIDIRTASVVVDHDRKVIKYGPLVFDGYSNVLMAGLNNGHTNLEELDKKREELKAGPPVAYTYTYVSGVLTCPECALLFATEGNADNHPTLTGGPLKNVYRLEQVHFHWLSEHSVDGLKYPMEIHFVHVRKDLNVSKALKEKDGLAIVAVFCNVLDSDIDVEFSQMEQVMHKLPRLDKVGNRISGVVLNLTRLFPVNPQSYVTYEGSLTSPECNEVVTWIIMDKPIVISDIQFRRISATGAGRYNFRTVQPYNHTVYRPVEALSTPLLVQALGDMLSLLTGFVRNVSRILEQSKESL